MNRTARGKAAVAGVLVLLFWVAACSPPGWVAPQGDEGRGERVADLEAELQRYREQVEQLSARADELAGELDALKRQEERRLAWAREGLDFTHGQHPGQVVTVYYWDDLNGPDTLQPVEVLVPAEQHPLRAAVEAWVRGAPAYGLHSGLGSYPELLGFSVEDGVAYLDFDARFGGFPGGSAWERALKISLTYTVTEIEGIEAVVVTVNGKPAMLHGDIWDTPRQRWPLDERERMADLIRYDGPGRPFE